MDVTAALPVPPAEEESAGEESADEGPSSTDAAASPPTSSVGSSVEPAWRSSGWMYKRSTDALFKGWKRRWFLLAGGTLRYWASPAAAGKPALGSIALHDATLYPLADLKGAGKFKATAFRIGAAAAHAHAGKVPHAAGKVRSKLTLAAEHQGELAEWMAALRFWAVYGNGPALLSSRDLLLSRSNTELQAEASEAKSHGDGDDGNFQIVPEARAKPARQDVQAGRDEKADAGSAPSSKFTLILPQAAAPDDEAASVEEEPEVSAEAEARAPVAEAAAPVEAAAEEAVAPYEAVALDPEAAAEAEAAPDEEAEPSPDGTAEVEAPATARSVAAVEAEAAAPEPEGTPQAEAPAAETRADAAVEAEPMPVEAAPEAEPTAARDEPSMEGVAGPEPADATETVAEEVGIIDARTDETLPPQPRFSEATSEAEPAVAREAPSTEGVVGPEPFDATEAVAEEVGSLDARTDETLPQESNVSEAAPEAEPAVAREAPSMEGVAGPEPLDATEAVAEEVGRLEARTDETLPQQPSVSEDAPEAEPAVAREAPSMEGVAGPAPIDAKEAVAEEVGRLEARTDESPPQQPIVSEAAPEAEPAAAQEAPSTKGVAGPVPFAKVDKEWPLDARTDEVELLQPVVSDGSTQQVPADEQPGAEPAPVQPRATVASPQAAAAARLKARVAAAAAAATEPSPEVAAARLKARAMAATWEAEAASQFANMDRDLSHLASQAKAEAHDAWERALQRKKGSGPP